MKKRLATICASMLCACACMAWDVGGKDYVVVAWPTTYTNGTFYSLGATNGYDLTAYNGIGKLIVFVSGDEGTAASTNADKVFMQHSNLETGTYSTVTTIADSMPTLGATAKVAKVTVDLETLKNWVRLGVTTHSLANTNASHTVGAVLVCPQKND